MSTKSRPFGEIGARVSKNTCNLKTHGYRGLATVLLKRAPNLIQIGRNLVEIIVRIGAAPVFIASINLIETPLPGTVGTETKRPKKPVSRPLANVHWIALCMVRCTGFIPICLGEGWVQAVGLPCEQFNTLFIPYYLLGNFCPTFFRKNLFRYVPILLPLFWAFAPFPSRVYCCVVSLHFLHWCNVSFAPSVEPPPNSFRMDYCNTIRGFCSWYFQLLPFAFWGIFEASS